MCPRRLRLSQRAWGGGDMHRDPAFQRLCSMPSAAKGLAWRRRGGRRYHRRYGWRRRQPNIGESMRVAVTLRRHPLAAEGPVPAPRWARRETGPCAWPRRGPQLCLGGPRGSARASRAAAFARPDQGTGSRCPSQRRTRGRRRGGRPSGRACSGTSRSGRGGSRWGCSRPGCSRCTSKRRAAQRTRRGSSCRRADPPRAQAPAIAGSPSSRGSPCAAFGS
mmetsp:Transcript_80709/g.233409  ORF Transcript_80709/g.233409 Transcript_80709/m.233409 type:complete len:220 (-) Transcript_80709:498-1157(-)